MADIRTHMVHGQLDRCRSAVYAGTAPGGLFAADEVDGEVVDMAVPRAVQAVISSAIGVVDDREDPEPHLRSLTTLAAMARAAEVQMHFEVRKLRQDGVSWAQIAEITGMNSRQAAQKRWG
ncbi:hypothetical protein ACWGRN_29930 [Streptomyces albidoflavus]